MSLGGEIKCVTFVPKHSPRITNWIGTVANYTPWKSNGMCTQNNSEISDICEGDHMHSTTITAGSQFITKLVITVTPLRHL